MTASLTRTLVWMPPMPTGWSPSYEQSVKLWVGKRAQRKAAMLEQWWVEHRQAAPTLFTDELEQTFEQISDSPSAGIPWPTARRPDLCRILPTAAHTPRGKKNEKTPRPRNF